MLCDVNTTAFAFELERMRRKKAHTLSRCDYAEHIHILHYVRGFNQVTCFLAALCFSGDERTVVYSL